MNLQLVFSHLLTLLAGVPLTLKLVMLSLLFGLALGSVAALVRSLRVPVLARGVDLYVYAIRGTPLLGQIFLIYFGLGQLEFIRDSFAWPVLREEFWCAIIALSLNTGAYTSELIRGGIQAIHHGQIEAAIAFGMNRRTRLFRVIIPQALRQFLPAYGNECISMVKSSALVSMITLMEVTGIARNLASKTYTPIETFVAAGLIYLALNSMLAWAFARVEHKVGFPR